jgi:hypothetical protein
MAVTMLLCTLYRNGLVNLGFGSRPAFYSADAARLSLTKCAGAQVSTVRQLAPPVNADCRNAHTRSAAAALPPT